MARELAAVLQSFPTRPKLRVESTLRKSRVPLRLDLFGADR
jgi:hypothetical protein